MGDVTSPPETPQGDAGLKERFFRYFQQEVAGKKNQPERKPDKLSMRCST